MALYRHHVLLLASAVLLSNASIAAASNVEVRRVTLATGGIAEVEGGVSSATETMRLSIERPQVADVLRTLVVTGNGRVVSIDLEAAESVGARSSAGRLLTGNLAAAETLLRSLIGEEIELVGGPNRASGRLLAFERVDIPPKSADDDVGTRTGVRVAIASPEGRVGYTTFPSLDTLSIEGDAVAERMKELLPAIATSVDDGRREFVVTLAAPAEPGFRFVVPTTVWRPSYRALVRDDGSVGLQGWATLENTTGLDWKGIDLRLAVGTPVAYAQDIYSPLRTRRPNAPFQVGQTAQTGIVPGQVARSSKRSRSAGLSAEAPQMALADLAMEATVATGAPPAVSSATSIFPVAGKIDLDAGRTLSVPFLSADREAGRIAYLDLARGDRKPLDALELTFDPDATVPGGLVAVYDQDDFAGDARFGGSDGGETRILPFAVSAGVNATLTERTGQTIASASFTDGALVVTREALRTITMSLETKNAVPLVVDLPRISGETVTADGSNSAAVSVDRIDEGRERVRIALPEGATELTLRATRSLSSRILVVDLDLPMIEDVLSAGGAIDEATRDRLRKVAATQARIAALGRQENTISRNVNDLRQALQNDRANLEAIGPATPEGSKVRQRIIERTEATDRALDELRTIRAETLELRAELGTR